MKERVNFHTHTFRCKHAEGTEEDYIKSAIKKDVKVLGFSDHGPFPDDRFLLRMDYCELSQYVNTIEDLRKKYEDKVKVLIGLEIEYYEELNDYYKNLLNKLGMQYLILGQHIYKYDDEFINVFSLNDTKQYIYYAKEVKKAIESGFFKVIAHPDVIFINELVYDENCEEACSIIIEAAKENNSILEFNANGLRRGIYSYKDGYRYPYPYIRFWESVAKNNIRVLIGSDCHKPDEVYDEYMDKAYKLVKDLDLNIIYDIK